MRARHDKRIKRFKIHQSYEYVEYIEKKIRDRIEEPHAYVQRNTKNHIHFCKLRQHSLEAFPNQLKVIWIFSKLCFKRNNALLESDRCHCNTGDYEIYNTRVLREVLGITRKTQYLQKLLFIFQHSLLAIPYI